MFTAGAACRIQPFPGGRVDEPRNFIFNFHDLRVVRDYGALYFFGFIPRVATRTNNLFEERMLDKTWDIPAMLEDYTEHLAIVFSEIIKTLVPQVIGGVYECRK